MAQQGRTERMNQDPNKMTMAEHAAAWWTEKGNVVPTRDSVEWDIMYWEWIDFAFGAEASYEGEIR